MQREHEHCCTPAEHRAERVGEEVVHIAHAASGEKLRQLDQERNAEARAQRGIPLAKRFPQERQQHAERDEERDVEQHVEPDLQREALVRFAPGAEKLQIPLPRGKFIRLAAQQRDEDRDHRPADEQHRADRLSPREAAAFFAADGIADGQNKAADKRSGHGKAHPALQKIKKIGNKVVHELPPEGSVSWFHRSRFCPLRCARSRPRGRRATHPRFPHSIWGRSCPSRRSGG